MKTAHIQPKYGHKILSLTSKLALLMTGGQAGSVEEARDTIRYWGLSDYFFSPHGRRGQGGDGDDGTCGVKGEEEMAKWWAGERGTDVGKW